MDDKIKKWCNWLDVIGRQIQNVLVKQDTHRTILRIIADNKDLQQHNLFYDHLFHTYISYITISLRRQLKINKDSISLCRLLSDMSKNYTILPENYKSELDVIRDIDEIKAVSCVIEDYVDKRIAHTDKRALNKLPSPNEIDDCIFVLKKIHKKYYSILFNKDIELMPVLYEWTDIFKIPWIREK